MMKEYVAMPISVGQKTASLINMGEILFFIISHVHFVQLLNTIGKCIYYFHLFQSKGVSIFSLYPLIQVRRVFAAIFGIFFPFPIATYFLDFFITEATKYMYIFWQRNI